MESPPRKTYLLSEEYLALDRAAEFRYEFYDGQMFRVGDPPRAFDGASLQRNRIAGNLYSAVRHQFKDGRFEAFLSDIRVALDRKEFAYPDLVIISGKPELFPDRFRLDCLLNPRVIIEILPNFAVDWDWGHRFNHYQRHPSFQQYVLISQDAPAIAQFDRQADHTWVRTDIAWPDGVLTLDSVGVAISLPDIYFKALPIDQRFERH